VVVHTQDAPPADTAVVGALGLPGRALAAPPGARRHRSLKPTKGIITLFFGFLSIFRSDCWGHNMTFNRCYHFHLKANLI
jgi:hypothetical protein